MFTWLTKSVGLFTLCGTILLLGCGGGGTGDKTHLRAMNEVPDESTINVVLDGSSVASSLAYGFANDYAETKSGSRHLQVQPTSSSTVFLDQTINLAGGTNTTVIVANSSSSSSAIILTDDSTASTTTGNIKLRIVNASPGIGTADVYVVPPNTNLNNVTPSVTSLGFESASAYLDIGAGTYNIVFTPPGSKFAVLFGGPVTFNPGQNRTIVAQNSLSGGFAISTLNDLN